MSPSARGQAGNAGLVLERCDPRAFREDLVALFERDGDADFQRLFDWYYLDSGDGTPVSWLMRDRARGDTVGMSSVAARRLRWGQTSLKAGVLGNMLVDRNYRKTFAGLELMRAAQSLVVRKELDVLLGMPRNERVLEFALRMGFSILSEWVTCAFIFRSRTLLEPLFGRLGASLSPLVDIWAASRRLHAAGGLCTPPHYRVFELNEEHVEKLDVSSWSPAAGRFVDESSPAFLRWRFLRAPLKHYRVLGLAQARSSDVCGYVVVASESKRMRVWDCQTDAARLSDSEAILTVWRECRGDSEILSVPVLADSPLCKDLKGLGFVRYRPFWGPRVDNSYLVGYWTPDHPLAKEFANPGYWNLFLGFNDV